MFRTIILILFLSLSSFAFADGQYEIPGKEWKKIYERGNWQLYKSTNKKITKISCVIISFPKTMNGNIQNRKRPYVSIFKSLDRAYVIGYSPMYSTKSIFSLSFLTNKYALIPSNESYVASALNIEGKDILKKLLSYNSNFIISGSGKNNLKSNDLFEIAGLREVLKYFNGYCK